MKYRMIFIHKRKSMKKIYWRLAEHNAYIGIQCKEYQKRHKFIWGRRWWFLVKCIIRNQMQDRIVGKVIQRKDIVQIFSRYDVISFDIFDTLLIRPYDKPTDLFEELEKRYFMPGFARARVEAEQRAREKYILQEDVTLVQIYEMIDAVYLTMSERETALERAVVRANKIIKILYDEAVRLGKHIVIVSDMCLTKDFLKTILWDNGYSVFEKVYVSSETGHTKASGNMYQYVLNDFGCKAEEILHIGDNFVSDGNACRESLIDTLLIAENKTLVLISKI